MFNVPFMKRLILICRARFKIKFAPWSSEFLVARWVLTAYGVIEFRKLPRVAFGRELNTENAGDGCS